MSYNVANSYNDLSDKNKALATQYANSSSSSEKASYKSEYDSNASEMKSYKSAMQTWDMLTLVGLGLEAYLYFSDDSKETAVNYRNSSFKFIHVSTDEVYGDLDDGGYFTENTPYNPSSPYSATKASSDHLARAWNRTYDLPVAITNCSNNYGPFQFPEKLIPLMIINCLDWKPLPVYGDGQNIRDWLFVDDHCSAIKAVYENGMIGETYNIGGNNEIKNIDIVNTICTILDDLRPTDNGKSYSELITFVKDRPGHDFRYAIKAKKIQNELGWYPCESFETGIKKTIEWYLENESWWKKIQEEKYNQERLGGSL